MAYVRHNQRVKPTITDKDYTTQVLFKNNMGRVSEVQKAWALNAEYKGDGEIVVKETKKEDKKESKKKK